ncbi:MAG: hypothetical protein ACFE91_01370 [Promethearchaeota archaeon]
MDYKFIETITLDFDFGKLLSVDFNLNYGNLYAVNLTDNIVNEIIDCIQNEGFPDFIWFKGIRTALKHKKCKEIVKKVKKIYPNQKIGIYLNCELFQDVNLRKDFHKYDLVAINLNTVDPINFSKINQCSDSVDSKEVLEGIKEFRKKFNGNLGIYSLFLHGINDNRENLESLKIFLLKTMPDHFSISTYTLNGFEPISKEFKNQVKETFRYLPFKVYYRF